MNKRLKSNKQIKQEMNKQVNKYKKANKQVK